MERSPLEWTNDINDFDMKTVTIKRNRSGFLLGKILMIKVRHLGKYIIQNRRRWIQLGP